MVKIIERKFNMKKMLKDLERIIKCIIKWRIIKAEIIIEVYSGDLIENRLIGSYIDCDIIEFYKDIFTYRKKEARIKRMLFDKDFRLFQKEIEKYKDRAKKYIMTVILEEV